MTGVATMSESADPTYWLAIWFLAAFAVGLILYAAITLAANGLVAALAWIDRRQQRKQADDDWAALLAAVGMTPADMRRRWDERGAL